MLGFVFLWAFLDKAFGLGYSTAPAKAWISGGSPTSGFLGHVEAGPFRGLFTGLAGSAVVDVLFMLGMLAIGVALILGGLIDGSSARQLSLHVRDVFEGGIEFGQGACLCRHYT